METFYVAWRKYVRRILGIPPTTHCKYLHYIADDRDIKAQLHKRFMKFTQSAHQLSNLISNLCVRLALSGSRTDFSNNISVVGKSYVMIRFNICTCSPVYTNINDTLLDEETKSSINVIKELLYTKQCLIISKDQFVLNMDEINHIITQLCTE